MKIFYALFIIFPTSIKIILAQTTIPLYPLGKIPNSIVNKNVVEKSEVYKDGILIINNITEPHLLIYPAPLENATGTAIIIFPGGGYSDVAAGHEGIDVAKAFNTMGITAFVVEYRLPDKRVMTNPEIGPLQDAQRAIQFVRGHAHEWKVDMNKIGIIGFSAGGHLASSAGTKFSKGLIDNSENINLRPDFMMLIYPVISSDSLIRHDGSFINLLGKNPIAKKLLEYSNEKNITTQTPPTFLVHASDDATVSAKNSIVFYEALLAHNVPAELHLYQSGGHGFGLKNPTTSDEWMSRLGNWLKMNGF